MTFVLAILDERMTEALAPPIWGRPWSSFNVSMHRLVGGSVVGAEIIMQATLTFKTESGIHVFAAAGDKQFRGLQEPEGRALVAALRSLVNKVRWCQHNRGSTTI